MAEAKREIVLSDRTLRHQETARVDQFLSKVHSIDVEEQERPSIQKKLPMIYSGPNTNIVADVGVSHIIDNQKYR